MLEDEYIIPFFHGSELAVTTGSKVTSDPHWLLTLVEKLCERHASGLIINVGGFIHTIPQEVIDYCNANDFPLLAMPWKMRITEMTQSFCIRIIQEEHETVIHDKAMADAIFRRGNEEEYREILSRYYDLDGKFSVILIYVKSVDEDLKKAGEMQDLLINRVRRFKTRNKLRSTKVGLIGHDNTELMILNNTDISLLPTIQKIILDVYGDTASVHMGIGIEVDGLDNIYRSYHRARTAMRMAVYRQVPYIRFEDMGFYKILFSVKDDDILSAYAKETLGPLLQPDAKSQQYLLLLKTYIEHDRSLEKTAAALFLHRNTVNYQIQKLKTILNCPLKTVDDLFPYQVALAILDMENHMLEGEEKFL